jgi:hypothetical protein
MVECQLPKLEVVGSSPIARSRFLYTTLGFKEIGFAVVNVYERTVSSSK